MDYNEEMKLWKTGWICLTAVIITLILSLSIKFHMDNRIAFENGYERVQAIGNTADRWAKIK